MKRVAGGDGMGHEFSLVVSGLGTTIGTRRNNSDVFTFPGVKKAK